MLMGSYSGRRLILRPLALVLILFAAVVFLPLFGRAQSPRKLTKQDVIDLLTGDVPSDEVAREAQKSGITFQLTAAVAKEIRDAGGTDALVRTLRTLSPNAPAVPSKPPRPPPAASPPTLLIESTPGQSQVYVDDEPVGTTSQLGRLKLSKLAAGDHRVRVSLGGYEDHEEAVTLTDGHVTTVAAVLQRPEAPPPVVAPPVVTPPPDQPPIPTAAQAGYLGVLPAQQQPDGARGVVISGTQPGGPAALAGLKAYDTILAVNGQPVTNPRQLRATLASHQVGEVVRITWYNGTSNVTRQIQLSAPPGQAAVQPGSPPPPPNIPQLGGMTFAVAHDHGQSGKEYCTGIMTVSNGVVYYKGIKGTNGVHNFEINLNSIKEARRNAVYLVAIGAFHIHTKRGTNYNFVVINAQGQFQPPDQILDAIENAKGK